MYSSPPPGSETSGISVSQPRPGSTAMARVIWVTTVPAPPQPARPTAQAKVPRKVHWFIG